MTVFTSPVPDADRCCAITTYGTRCKRPHMPGYRQCDTHGHGRKYFVQFQWRRDVPNGPYNDWRSWRAFGVWPKLFATHAEAADAMKTPLLFANMGDRRKVSASVGRTRTRYLIADPI